MRGVSVALLLFAAGLHAQQTMPVGILRGNLVAWQNGGLSVRQADGAVYECSYDKHTLFQRNQWPIQSSALVAGEPVEVVSDRWPATRGCYVRMVSVIYASPKSPRRQVPAADVWVPRGYLTFSGLVVKNEDSKITLKTSSGPRTLRLRPDTRYSEASQPLLNKHVFVRAGRSIEGVLEAYQVMWGEILLVP
jgi:hypothetical protein